MVAENDGKTGVWRVIYVDGKLVGNISVEQRQDVICQDFFRTQIRICAKKCTECLGGVESIPRIADQHYRIVNPIQAPFIPINVKLAAAKLSQG